MDNDTENQRHVTVKFSKKQLNPSISKPQPLRARLPLANRNSNIPVEPEEQKSIYNVTIQASPSSPFGPPKRR